MKTSITIALIFLLISIFSFSIGRQEFTFLKGDPHIDISQKKQRWIKNVWSEIDTSAATNSAIFYPYNEYPVGYNHSYEGEGWDPELIQKQIKAIKPNLYNILFYSILKGDLTIYSPFDPNWVNTEDNGFLFYPFTSEKWGSKQEGTFFTDDKFKNSILNMEFIGYEMFQQYPEAMRSTEFPGEDSIDASGNVVYYPNEYYWYKDKDIIKYQIKESWEIDEQGNLLQKNIDAICPIVSYFDPYSGEIIGEKLLFWIDYQELAEILGQYYIEKPGPDKKIRSMKDYFDNKLYHSTIVRNDSVHVMLKKK